MELLGLFVTAFLAGFSGAAAPGPLLAVTVGESARRGFGAGLLLSLGHALLELALVAALAMGLAGFFTGGVLKWTGALGGAVLIWMGWNMAGEARAGKITLELSGRDIKGGKLHPVLAGALVSVSNPYWTLWWATVGLGYMTYSLQWGKAGLALFFTGHIMADFTWYGLVAAACAGGRKVCSDSVYRALMVICGVFLVLLGGYFIFWAAGV